jgi:hypothetical protein
MRFPKETLLRLLEHDKDLVGANYTSRKLPIQPLTLVRRNEGGPYERVVTGPDSHGLEKVNVIGFGCVLTKTAVFAALERPWFHLIYRKDTGDFGGEDAFFCMHASAGGYDIFIDHDLSRDVAHTGEMDFRHEHAAAMAAATADQPSEDRPSA